LLRITSFLGFGVITTGLLSFTMRAPMFLRFSFELYL